MAYPTIIGLGHKKGVGKDQIANRLIDAHGFIKIAFADPVKDACKIIFKFNERQLHGDLKEVVDKNWGKTPREIYQQFATNACRDVIHKDIWVKSLELKIQELLLKNPDGHELKIVISDVRFFNEADFVKQQHGCLWKINRVLPPNRFGSHLSEIELDDYESWDLSIENNGSMAELYQKTDRALSIEQENSNAYHIRKPESTRDL